MAFDPAHFEIAQPTGHIHFDYQISDFSLQNPARITGWIETIIHQYACELVHLDYVFCDDAFLHRINVQFLDHDTLTDIITFPFQKPPRIEGEVYISVERVRENAQEFGVPFREELYRVIIHGVLHLCGQGDKTEAERSEMRRKEDAALKVLLDRED